MSIRRLTVPALLILVLPFSAHAQQSLGDLAREQRSERQQSGTPHRKVYTNEDLASHSSNVAESRSKEAPAAKDGKDSDTAAQANASGSPTNSAANDATPNNPSSPESEREARELEIQKREQAINQKYLDRIAELHEKIDSAQKETARLQRDQVESTNEFRISVGSNPSIAEYEQQQRLFSEQIDAQQTLLISLKAQLEDAKEAARHAGVPHATDY